MLNKLDLCSLTECVREDFVRLRLNYAACHDNGPYKEYAHGFLLIR